VYRSFLHDVTAENISFFAKRFFSFVALEHLGRWRRLYLSVPLLENRLGAGYQGRGR